MSKVKQFVKKVQDAFFNDFEKFVLDNICYRRFRRPYRRMDSELLHHLQKYSRYHLHRHVSEWSIPTLISIYEDHRPLIGQGSSFDELLSSLENCDYCDNWREVCIITNSIVTNLTKVHSQFTKHCFCLRYWTEIDRKARRIRYGDNSKHLTVGQSV